MMNRIEDAAFAKGYEQAIHESLISILDMLTIEDLTEEWIWLVEYYNVRKSKG
jgi:hypothetical protein